MKVLCACVCSGVHLWVGGWVRACGCVKVAIQLVQSKLCEGERKKKSTMLSVTLTSKGG